MINLHQKYNHYLNNPKKKLDGVHGIEESLRAYGWTDDGKDITGYYLITENYTIFYDTHGRFLKKHKND